MWCATTEHFLLVAFTALRQQSPTYNETTTTDNHTNLTGSLRSIAYSSNVFGFITCSAN